MANPKVTLDGDAKRLLREFEKVSRVTAKLTQELKKTAAAGQQMGKETERASQKQSTSMKMGIGMAKNLAGALGLAGGVAGAVALIRQGYQAWLQDIKNVNTAANKLQTDLTAFAAMQTPGTKREAVLKAGHFAASQGVSSQEGFGTIQAMQSGNLGSLTRGMTAAKTIFQAKQLGIPVDLGTNLEVAGTASGMGPGDALRHAYVAGQTSKRDPAMLALAPKGATFWEDKSLAFAAAGPLAAQFGNEFPTYLRQGAIGLSMETGPAVTKRYEEMGLGYGATQRQRYDALHKMGLRSTEDLSQFGFSELRQRQAISNLLQNREELVRVEQAVRTRAKPGLFAADIKAMFAEFPERQNTFNQSVIAAQQNMEKSLGPGAVAAGKEITARGIQAQVYTRRNRRVAGPWALTEKGDDDLEMASPGAAGKSAIWEAMNPLSAAGKVATPGKRLEGLFQLTMGPLSGMIGAFSEMKEQSEETNKLLREGNAQRAKQQGPSTLAHPDSDPK